MHLACQHVECINLHLMGKMTSEQIRAARAMLRIEQGRLAEMAGVSVETIKRLEKMDGAITTVRVATVNAIRAALEAAGVIFVAENGEGPGVRLRKAALK